MSSNRRPELQAPAEIYYDEKEAKKYTRNTRIIEIQEKCSERAMELLALPDDSRSLLLDLGCGSGLSGEVITEHGHHWIGLDISEAMLDIAVEREVEGDVLLGDFGEGLPFRAASFDGAIGISAIQWLCYANKKSHNPNKRLYKFFSSLYACLNRGARAVFQFYPENEKQVDLIVTNATRAGFTGGLVVDFPNSTKAKKIYLVLMCGTAAELPRGLSDEAESTTQALYQKRERMNQFRNKNFKKEWIKAKKERRKRQGKDIRQNSKYTGRKRSGRF